MKMRVGLLADKAAIDSFDVGCSRGDALNDLGPSSGRQLWVSQSFTALSPGPRNVNCITVSASTSCTKWLEEPYQERAYVQKYCLTDTKAEKDGCSGPAIRKCAQVSDACLTSLRGFTET